MHTQLGATYDDVHVSCRSHWTMGVCIVLLPYLRQIIITHRKGRSLEVVNEVISLVVKRFSSAVLTCELVYACSLP